MSAKYALAAAALVGGLSPLALVVTAGAMGAGSSGASGESPCVAMGSLPGLSSSQSGNAETIVAVAEDMPAGSQLAARIAVMAAYTESRLIDLGPETGSDSLGLFQQRASQGWGTPAQEEDSVEATAMFVSVLVALPGWESMPPWQAAQDVQHSTFANGSNYRANWQLARHVVSQVDALNGAEACGEWLDAVPAGPPERFGLPVGYIIPVSADPAEFTAISYALAQLGKPYVWGGAGPEAFDCSGLTMTAWAAAGVTLLHSTLDQMAEGTPVDDLSELAPGDLVLIPGSDGTLAAPGHVGIYLGDGLVESAVDPAQGVIVQSWGNFVAGGLSGVRHVG